MSYFNELPNIEYISPFSDKTSNKDYVLSKNIFSRAKVKNNILNNITAFTPYYIKDGERPDIIANKAYNNSELDWVVLTTNNITNINEQWPLDNNSLYKYLLDKYGSEEALGEVHHYETIELKDQYNRVILDGGLQVDSGFTRTFLTEEGQGTYSLPQYQDSNLNKEVKINLNQVLEIPGRNFIGKIKINDIKIKSSSLFIQGRENSYEINITNTLSPWPASWGGSLNVKTRSGTVNVEIGDGIGDTYINIPDYLYKIVKKEVNGEIISELVFTPQA